MSRFHFDEAVMSEVAAALSSASGETSVNHTLLLSKLPQVFFQSGFGIENSLSNIQDVMKSDSKLLEKIRSGAETLVKIKDTVSRYDKAAISSDIDSAINYETEGGVCAPKQDFLNNKVNSDDFSDNNVKNNNDIVSNGWIREDGYFEYSFSENLHVIRDNETNGEKEYKLVPAIDLFGGWHGGYVQSRAKGDSAGWFQSDYQCVATAMATTAVYNGGDPKVVTPHSYYSESDYWLGYNGCAVGCNWTQYGELNEEQFLSIIKNKLISGKASTIYAHKDETHNTGHALTVIGYMNSGNSIYDLIVVDPWSGRECRLGDTITFNKGYNGWFTLDKSN